MYYLINSSSFSLYNLLLFAKAYTLLWLIVHHCLVLQLYNFVWFNCAYFRMLVYLNFINIYLYIFQCTIYEFVIHSAYKL